MKKGWSGRERGLVNRTERVIERTRKRMSVGRIAESCVRDRVGDTE